MTNTGLRPYVVDSLEVIFPLPGRIIFGLGVISRLSGAIKRHAESVLGFRSRQRNPLESVMTADVWPPSCA